MPSRERNPFICAAGELRGAPASTTATLRLARDSTNAADRPAAPPPITTTSNSFLSMSLSFMSFMVAGTAWARQPLLLFLGHRALGWLDVDATAPGPFGRRLKWLRFQREALSDRLSG